MAVFNFWDSQRKALAYTTRYLILYVLLLVAGGAIVEVLYRYTVSVTESQNVPLMLPGALFVFITACIAQCYYQYYKTEAAIEIFVDTSKAVLIEASSEEVAHQTALNIVEEMAIASQLPKPKLYLIPVQEINSLTLGFTPENSAIFITQGALEGLTRDELQAMIGYEISHIVNKDFRLLIWLSAMLMSFFLFMKVGRNIIKYQNSYSDGGSKKTSKKNDGRNFFLFLALALMIAGAFLMVLGRILQSLIGNQRVYLADASAVQFTRNSGALISLLEKISQTPLEDLPRKHEGLTLLYLVDKNTQPSLEKRLRRLKREL